MASAASRTWGGYTIGQYYSEGLRRTYDRCKHSILGMKKVLSCNFVAKNVWPPFSCRILRAHIFFMKNLRVPSMCKWSTTARPFLS